MRIAVLSGKGGTGKTLVSVNLAAVATQATYIDCDVEEPNGHIFFKPENCRSKEVSVQVPVLKDETRCKGCRKCVDFCRFNALAFINDRPFVMEEICHSCGGCVLFCPERALSETPRVIGKIFRGISENVVVATGMLNTGEQSGVPIIRQLLEGMPMDREPVFIDCPPGTSCTVIECIKAADYCVLVAEPTLFGAHNLNMAYELIKFLRKPHGVVLNKWLAEKDPVQEYCVKNNVPIIGTIPFHNELGKLNSTGLISVREDNQYQDLFEQLLERVTKEAKYEAAPNP